MGPYLQRVIDFRRILTPTAHPYVIGNYHGKDKIP